MAGRIHQQGARPRIPTTEGLGCPRAPSGREALTAPAGAPRISQRFSGAPVGVLPGSCRVWSRGVAARASGPLPLTRDTECGGALHFDGGSPIRQEARGSRSRIRGWPVRATAPRQVNASPSGRVPPEPPPRHHTRGPSWHVHVSSPRPSLRAETNRARTGQRPPQQPRPARTPLCRRHAGAHATTPADHHPGRTCSPCRRSPGQRSDRCRPRRRRPHQPRTVAQVLMPLPGPFVRHVRRGRLMTSHARASIAGSRCSTIRAGSSSQTARHPSGMRYTVQPSIRTSCVLGGWPSCAGISMAAQYA